MSVNGLRCIKDRDLEEEREGREREREALEAVVVALRVFFFFFVKLLYCMPHRCTRGGAATVEREKDLENIMFASLEKRHSR